MFHELKALVSSLITSPRALKPQTERQIAHYLQEYGGDEAGFLTRAASLLEEHDLEILLAPEFTPELNELAAVSDLLARWRLAESDIQKLQAELRNSDAKAVLQLADGSEVRVPLHEVMISRFVKLLRLEHAPDFKIASALQDALPSDLYQAALALMRQRGFTPERQAWFAGFVAFLARRHPLNVTILATAAQFIVGQTTTETTALLAAANDLARSAKSSADYARNGRVYWSPDVAEHHQFRGQGQVDTALVNQRLEELDALEKIAAGLSALAEVKLRP